MMYDYVSIHGFGIGPLHLLIVAALIIVTQRKCAGDPPLLRDLAARLNQEQTQHDT